jgi:hypothetical protein
MPQIVKTNKRCVFATGSTWNNIGVTATAFFDLDGLTNDFGITKGHALLAQSGITNGTASISRIVSGSTGFNVSMSGQIVFTGSAAGEYNFERYTLKPLGINPGGTMGITVNAAGTVIVEVVL